MPYEGRGGRGGIGVQLLQGVRDRLGWEPIRTAAPLIGLFDERAGGAISLEPGGQFELSGAPLPDIHETEAELVRTSNSSPRLAAPLGIAFAGSRHEPAVEAAEHAASCPRAATTS